MKELTTMNVLDELVVLLDAFEGMYINDRELSYDGMCKRDSLFYMIKDKAEQLQGILAGGAAGE